MRIADKICRRTDLKSGVQRESLGRLFGTGENMGHVFAIEVLDGGRDVNLTGAEVTAYFIKPNNSTVTIAGDTYCSTAGNVCTVALPEECYTVTGRFTFTVCLTLDGVMHAVYSASGYVSRSSTDQIDDNTVTVTLGELKDRIDALNDSIPQDYGDMTRYIHAVCEAHTVSEFTDPVPAPLAKVQEEKVSGTKVRLSGQTSAPGRLYSLNGLYTFVTSSIAPPTFEFAYPAGTYELTWSLSGYQTSTSRVKVVGVKQDGNTYQDMGTIPSGTVFTADAPFVLGIWIATMIKLDNGMEKTEVDLDLHTVEAKDKSARADIEEIWQILRNAGLTE